MDDLNKLERVVLQQLSEKYPAIKSHIPHLKVKDRQNTGVGMFVNFFFATPDGILSGLDMEDCAISTNDNIRIEGLEHGLGYEVDITKGRINFIEFITYGEGWDGSSKNFSFERS